MRIENTRGEARQQDSIQIEKVSNQGPKVASGAVSRDVLSQYSGQELMRQKAHSLDVISAPVVWPGHVPAKYQSALRRGEDEPSLALRSQSLAPAQRTSVLAEPPQSSMYGADGALNICAMKDVLGGVKDALGRLSPSETHARHLIDKALETDILEAPKKLYSALKDISCAIARACDSNNMQYLAAAVMQIARTQNYQTGISAYDDAGNAASKNYLEKNPTIEQRSNAFTQDALTLGAQGGVAIGAAAGVADAVSLGANLGVNLSKTNMLLNDFDTDLLYIKKGQVAVSLSASGKVGELSSYVRAAQLAGSIDLKGVRGGLVEGQKVKDVVNYTIMHSREGGHALSPKLAPNKSELKSLANMSTRGVTGTLAGFARGIKKRLWNGQAADRQVQINTHKIIKGFTPSLFLVEDNSLLKGITECEELQKKLDRAYGAMLPRELPNSFKAVVGDASWLEVEGNVSGSATVFEIDVESVLSASLGGLALGCGLNHRWLPYRLWMAPHTALEALSDGKDDSKRKLLSRVCAEDSSITDYLDKIKGAGLRRLEHDIDTFESLANELLSMQSVTRGGDSSLVLRTHAQQHFDRGLKALQDIFLLKQTELEGLVADSGRLELTLARCWNRLSLGHALKSLDTPEMQQETLKTLGERIKEPAVLMAPTHLYHASSLQLEATVMRGRSTSTFTLTLPSISAGTATLVQAKLHPLGQWNATLTVDKVSDHPNVVRNGTFVTANLSATHLPKLDGMDKMAQAIAVKLVNSLQPGTDAKQMNKNEHAELVASISTSLMTGLASPASGEVGLSGGVARQFEVSLQRSEDGEPWRLCYFQSSNMENRSVGIKGEGSITVGLGGSVGMQAGMSALSNVVRPPILGSAPSYHILQFPRFKEALCESAGSGTLDGDKAVFDKLRDRDVAPMYFSNDAILDQLEHMCNLKEHKEARADVFGKLVRMTCNEQQYRAFTRSGLVFEDLREKIEAAKKVTHGTDMDTRLEFFTTNEGGRALLQEYASGMGQLATMKSRASMLHEVAGERAIKISILDAAGQKKALVDAR